MLRNFSVYNLQSSRRKRFSMAQTLEHFEMLSIGMNVMTILFLSSLNLLVEVNCLSCQAAFVFDGAESHGLLPKQLCSVFSYDI